MEPKLLQLIGAHVELTRQQKIIEAEYAANPTHIPPNHQQYNINKLEKQIVDEMKKSQYKEAIVIAARIWSIAPSTWKLP